MKCAFCLAKITCEDCGRRFPPSETETCSTGFDLSIAYDKAVATLDRFKLNRSGCPSLEQVKKLFTPAMLERVASFQGPRLILVPPCSWDEIKKAFKDVWVSDIYKDEKTDDWQAWIVEGAEEIKIHEWDDVTKTLGERIKNKKGGGINRFIYALLMMQTINDPIDKIGWTIFDADSAISSSRVPGGYFYDHGDRPYFYAYGPQYVGDFDRFRSVMGGCA